MQKLTIYPTIVDNFENDYEKEIFVYLKLLDDLQNESTVLVPNEFYTTELCEFLWGKNEPRLDSLIKYFTEVVLKSSKTESLYNEIFASLKNPHMTQHEAISGIYGNKYIDNDKLFIDNIDKVYLTKLFYLSLVNEFGYFKECAISIFKNLIFLDNSFRGVSSLGNAKTTKIELIRHLDILNRFAHGVYLEENRDAHLAMLKLNSTHSINCTGVGGKQNSSEFRIDDTYKGKHVNPRCNAHTKLFDARNDYRIYFSWENVEIGMGKVIIGSVGGHID